MYMDKQVRLIVDVLTGILGRFLIICECLWEET